MLLTVGVSSYNNYEEVWFTVQALRLYQDLNNVEILVIDNYGDANLEKFVNSWGKGQVRYVKYTDVQSPSEAKNRIFEEAKGDWVLAMDSHVLLQKDSLAQFKGWLRLNYRSTDLFHGPLLYDDLQNMADAMNDEWRDNMWGTWRNNAVSSSATPYEIPMHGMGLFASRRDSWLGFNPGFKGFGGEEGYIHAKYRKAGRRVVCLPFLQWNHMFRVGPPPFKVNVQDRIHNYLLGFEELGMDPEIVYNHFKIKR